MANYTGPSIVDYLKSVGQASDYTSRATLAQQKGITNYTGSAEQNTQLLNMLKGTGQSTNPEGTSFPSNPQLGTSDLTGGSNQQIDTNGPAIPTNTSNVLATVSGLIEQTKNIKTEVDKLASTPPPTTTPTETKTGTMQTILDKIAQRETTATSQPTSEELVNQALSKYGITPESYQEIQGLIGQLTSYNQQIADLQTRKQAAIDAIGEKPIDSIYISQEQAVQEKRYNSEIASVSAQAGVVSQTIQLKQGLIEDARQTSGLIIDAMMQDNKQKMADLDWAIDTYSDLYATMSAEEQQEWDNAYKVQKDATDKQKDDLNKLSDLIIDAAARGVDLGITLTSGISYEDALKIYQEKVSSKEAEGGGLTPTQKQEQVEISNITATLTASRGKDGFVDPGVYLSKRRKSTLGPTEFDNRFADLLSSKERQNLGITAQTYTSKEIRLQELLSKSNNGEDLDLLTDEEARELLSLL